jgi:hypothetical protein
VTGKIREILASLVILTILPACAGGLPELRQDEAEMETPPAKLKSSPPPAWVLGKGHPSYPLLRYVVGIGFSEKNSVSAFQSARSELAKSLKVEIRSKMQDISTVELTHIESIIETEVDTTLEGVNIQDGWYDSDKGVYYSLAALDRKLAAASVEERIKSIKANLYQYIQRGKDAESQGDVIPALSNYLSGYQEAPSLLPLKSMLRVITQSRGGANSDSPELKGHEFNSRIKQVVQNLKISVVSGNRQTVKSQKNLSESLKAKVYWQKGGQEVPLKNIPVRFKYTKGRGDLEEEKVSDSNGLVQTTIHKITSFEETNHTIAAQLDFERLISNFDRKSVGNILSPLQNVRTSFNYSIDKTPWESSKSQGWRSGITNLVNQVIKNISPNSQPVIGIVELKDLRYGKATSFSHILKEDIQNVLAQAEALTVKEVRIPEEGKITAEEIAENNGLELYVAGSYRMERAGLEIRARLIETATSNIKSAADIVIKKREINSEDLALLEKSGGTSTPNPFQDEYQEDLEKLVSSKPDHSPFNIKVWTNKKEYQIGEKITFSIKAEESCYLTLLDIGPSGNITVIFPNKYHKDNFIISGVTYQIPGPDYGFEFDVHGPAGLERIKAMATLKPDPLINLNFQQGFHSIERGTSRGTRDIKTIAKKFSLQSSSGWAEAYSEIFIFEKNKMYTRGARKIPILEKPKKPIDMIGTFGKEESRIED